MAQFKPGDQTDAYYAYLEALGQKPTADSGIYDTWRQYSGLQAGSALQTQMRDIRGNANRMGLTNSGFMNNMMQPAYQQYGQNLLGANAQMMMHLSDAEQQWIQQRLMAEMQRMNPTGGFQDEGKKWYDYALDFANAGSTAAAALAPVPAPVV